MIQIAVQGAWGVVPVHLNELSPDEARGVFPGLVYQLGNLFASRIGVWQTQYAEAHGNDYASALAYLIGGVALLIAVIVFFGPEARGKVFGRPVA
jgi:MFS transporter, SHS family, lactate transporter